MIREVDLRCPFCTASNRIGATVIVREPNGLALCIVCSKTFNPEDVPMLTKTLKPIAAVVLAAVLSACLAACGGKTPPQVLPPGAGQLPPAAESAILAGLESLQTLATVLGPVDGISAKDTAAIISACAAAVQIVQADKTGWVSAVDEALSVLPAQLSPSTAGTVQPYLDAISATIQALYGAGLS